MCMSPPLEKKNDLQGARKLVCHSSVEYQLILLPCYISSAEPLQYVKAVYQILL